MERRRSSKRDRNSFSGGDAAKELSEQQNDDATQGEQTATPLTKKRSKKNVDYLEALKTMIHDKEVKSGDSKRKSLSTKGNNEAETASVVPMEVEAEDKAKSALATTPAIPGRTGIRRQSVSRTLLPKENISTTPSSSVFVADTSKISASSTAPSSLENDRAQTNGSQGPTDPSDILAKSTIVRGLSTRPAPEASRSEKKANGPFSMSASANSSLDGPVFELTKKSTSSHVPSQLYQSSEGVHGSILDSAKSSAASQMPPQLQQLSAPPPHIKETMPEIEVANAVQESVSENPVDTSSGDTSVEERILRFRKILLVLGTASFCFGALLLLAQLSFPVTLPKERFYQQCTAYFGLFFLIAGSVTLHVFLSMGDRGDDKANVGVREQNATESVGWVSSTLMTESSTTDSPHSIAEQLNGTSPTRNERFETKERLLKFLRVLQSVAAGYRRELGVIVIAVVLFFILHSRIMAAISYVNANRIVIVYTTIVMLIFAAAAFGVKLHRQRQHQFQQVIDLLADEAMLLLKEADNEVGTPIEFVKEEVADGVSRLVRKYKAKQTLDDPSVGTYETLQLLSPKWLEYLCSKDNIRGLWTYVVTRVQQDKRIKRFDREYFGEKRTVWRRLDCRADAPVFRRTNSNLQKQQQQHPQ